MFGDLGKAVGGALGDAKDYLGGFGGGSWAGGLLNTGIDAAFGTNLTGTAAQLEMAEKANKFTAEENAKNREWQDFMASTAYKRTMQDMKQAGLNPMLAHMQGATKPSGGSAGGGVTAGALNPLGNAKLKSLDIKMQQQAIDNASHTGKQIKTQTHKAMEETKAIKYNNELRKQDEKFYRENPGAREAEKWIDIGQKAIGGFIPSVLGGAIGGGISSSAKRLKRKSTDEKGRKTHFDHRKEPNAYQKKYIQKGKRRQQQMKRSKKLWKRN